MISSPARAASSSALSGSTVIKALRSLSAASMRLRSASTTSTGESCFSRNARARLLSERGRSSSVGTRLSSFSGAQGSISQCSRRRSGYDLRVPKDFRTSLGFDRRVWLLLLAMLAFRFGQGLFYPFSAPYRCSPLARSCGVLGVLAWCTPSLALPQAPIPLPAGVPPLDALQEGAGPQVVVCRQERRANGSENVVRLVRTQLPRRLLLLNPRPEFG